MTAAARTTLQTLPRRIMEITEINDIQELEALRPVWRGLWCQMPEASFFQSCEWLEVAWRHTKIKQQLRVLVVGNREHPRGILPLVVRHEPRWFGAARVLTYPLDDWGAYYQPVGIQPAETLRAGLEHVLSSTRDWDLLDLRWTAPDALDEVHTRATLAELGLPVQTRLRHQTSVIDLEGTWEDYCKQRSKNWRSHYRRRQKKMHAAGSVRHERYRPRGAEHGAADPRWDLYDACTQLAAKSWQGSSRTGNTLNHADVHDLFRAAHEQAVNLGCLDLNLLYLDERPISFAYNYHHQGHVYALRLGYDPEFAQLGPGNMVEELAIADSYQRGDRIYELGPAAEASKRQLRTRLQPVWQHTHYPFAWRSQRMRWRAAASSWAGRWRDKIKKIRRA